MDSKYEKSFSNYLRNFLPGEAQGFGISDIDYLIMNFKTKKFLIIELKTLGNDLGKGQRQIYRMLHKRLARTNNRKSSEWDGYFYTGMFLIKFSGKDFSDGNVTIEGTGVEKRHVYQIDLIDFLSDKLS